MYDLDDIREKPAQEIERIEHDRIKAMIKADLKRIYKERAMKGYVPITEDSFRGY